MIANPGVHKSNLSGTGTTVFHPPDRLPSKIGRTADGGYFGTRRNGAIAHELTPAPQVVLADAGPGERFGDDTSQPDAADREPVFWTADGGQDFPADDGL